jgi:glycosyltransferase involved in cell wall biosynthesis
MMTALPLSFTAHAKDAYCEALNPAGLLERKLRAARFVVTCTEATRAYLQARTSTRVHCLYHGLDVEFAQLCLSRAALPREAAGPVRALAVGRLVAKKGLDVFIEACALLRARGLDLEARIVGEPGEHEAALRALVARDGLQRQVVFTGAMSREALFEEFQRATVFCLPCRVLENGDRDGIPNVVAEAMACGVPVVTTGVGGIAELVVHEVSGLLVPPDDAASVADAILRVHADARLRERVCRGARARIRRRFDGDATAGRLAALLQGAAA